ncbi:recombinase RecT [Clostridium sp.]|uniref:recombinase RecT n=1 Tax=Clostridium sp. TaxID=1506 RepID=UPI003991E37C
MATNSNLKNQLAKKQTGTSAAVGNTVKNLLAGPAIQKRFQEVLNKRAPQYMSSIVNLVNGDTNLQNCDPLSVISSCMVAATLDLPVDKNLGYAWVVPYGNKASFQLGYRGYIQLALRTGQYKGINVIDVHEGELINWNPLTEEVEIDFSQKKSDAIIGYAGYFKLINGFEKTVYWSKEQIENHRKKFSKSPFGWNKDFDAMARKTVIRNMLSKWGILSIEMQNAYTADTNTIKEDILKPVENEEEFNLASNIDTETIEVEHEVTE